MSIDNKIKTGVTISVIVSVLLAIVGFGYNNASLPKQQRQINEIQSDIKEVRDYITNDRVNKEVMKRDIKYTQQTVSDMKEIMKEGFIQLQQQLKEINRNIK